MFDKQQVLPQVSNDNDDAGRKLRIQWRYGLGVARFELYKRRSNDQLFVSRSNSQRSNKGATMIVEV